MPTEAPTLLADHLRTELIERGPGYQPRTEHLLEDGSPKYINRLIREDSPYLLQHAHNPVEWFAWGDEAFARAKRENKLIFLSIGYSTCHWCHVMERESFENEVVAAELNRHFIAIKVDREQRPDLDNLYMAAVTLISGQGGWPMSSILTPDGKTAIGGTYFPKDNFLRLLQQSHALWQSEPEVIQEQADRVAGAVAQMLTLEGSQSELGAEIHQQMVADMGVRFDELQGGFSEAPKFPQEPQLNYLIDRLWRENDPHLFEMIRITLDAMANGGLHDQVGGGFHRYSTDNEWLVPHFEKMLYNQGQMARLYLQMWQWGGDPRDARVAERIFDYLLREMRDSSGLFYAASDADSGDGEGEFFVWDEVEISGLFNQDDAEWLKSIYSISSGGNFEGKSIPFLREKLSSADFSRLDRLNKILWQQRQYRQHPHIDQKQITSWNGLVIEALAYAGEKMERSDYLQAAERAAEAIWSLRRENGGLWRITLEGRGSIEAQLEDYAYYGQGLISLYHATDHDKWLERTQLLADKMLELFQDQESGALFDALPDPAVKLMSRLQDGNDGATPSANGVAANFLLQLSSFYPERGYRQRALAIINAFSGRVSRQAEAYPTLLLAHTHAQLGERGEYPLAGQGRARIRWQSPPQSDSATTMLVKLSIALESGWHVNSNRPNQEGLVATNISVVDESVWQLRDLQFPKAEELRLTFLDEPLSLYTGKVPIILSFQRSEAAKVGQERLLRLQLRLQICSDSICLPPEDIPITMPLH